MALGQLNMEGRGASIVCYTIAQQIRNYCSLHYVLPADDELEKWVALARHRIQLAANKRNVKERDFATTMIFLVSSSQDILIARIGDGGVAARAVDSSAWTLLSEPQNGEYASTTYFVTDDLPLKLRISRHQNKFNALVAFSDGIQDLAINHVNGEALAKFFTPVTKPFDDSKVIGKDTGLTERLALFLGSNRVNERTDDDKTMIIAVAK